MNDENTDKDDAMENESLSSFPSLNSESDPSELSSLSSNSGMKAVLSGTFHKHGLYGRLSDKLKVENSFERMMKGGSSEIILITGDSGIGKSSLVESFRSWVTDKGGYFVSGKFDRTGGSTPFAALTEVLSDVCDLIGQEQNRFLHPSENEIRAHLSLKKLRERIGKPALLHLASLVNNFSSVFEVEENDHLDINTNGISFKTSCSHYLQGVASDESPMLVFLDDFHHADNDSLEVIDELLRNTESKNILYVFCLTEKYSKKVLDYIFFEENNKLKITEMNLKGLSIESINELLFEILKRDQSLISPLSEVIFSKTNGNPFFIEKYLDSLKSDGHLQCIKNEWNWNISSIIAGTDYSENLIQDVESRIESLHPDVRFMLKIASCIGVQFPRDIIDRFGLEYLANDNIELFESVREHFTCCFEIALQERLIEPTRNRSKFKFSHVRVQRLVAKLFPLQKTEQEALHFRIGNAAWNTSNDGQREWYVLAAAEQLKKCLDFIPESDRNHVQNINIRAAKIARSRNAFAPSADFLEVALSLMNDKDDWISKHQIMLTMHSMAAEMYMAAGLFHKCKSHADVIFQNSKETFDKMPAYFVMTESLAMQCQTEDTINMATEGLSQLGVKLNRNPRKIFLRCEIGRLKYFFEKKNDDEILSMAELKSKEKLAAMRLLGSLLSFSFFAGEYDLVTAVTIIMLKISLTEGISRMMPAALACWSILNARNPEKKKRFSELAKKLAIKMEAESLLYLTMTFAYGFSIHQNVSLQDTFHALDEGYNTGIDLGQMFTASVCRIWNTVISLQTGVPLPEAEHEAKVLCSRLRDRHQIFPLSCALPFWQVMLNMMGDSETEDPSFLSGKAINYLGAKCEAESKENKSGLYLIYYCAIFVSVFFGESIRALELIEKIKELGSAYENGFLSHGIKFFEGIATYERYKQSSKKSLLSRARSILKELKSISKYGNATCRAFLLFLNAEEVAIAGNMTETSKAFDNAIRELKHCNLLPFEALACERAGVFMLHENMTLLTENYFTRSLRLYKRWGARKKVERVALIMQGLPTSSRYSATRSRRGNLKKTARLSTYDTSILTELDTFRSRSRELQEIEAL